VGGPAREEDVWVLAAPRHALSFESKVPVLSNRPAREEGKEKEGGTPKGDNPNQNEGEGTSDAGLHVEKAQVLKENGELDKGGGRAVGYVGRPDVLIECE
jgi:hypothetical protein